MAVVAAGVMENAASLTEFTLERVERRGRLEIEVGVGVLGFSCHGLCELGFVAERLKSPGRDERFSIAKTPDFATRVHFFVIPRLFAPHDVDHMLCVTVQVHCTFIHGISNLS